MVLTYLKNEWGKSPEYPTMLAFVIEEKKITLYLRLQFCLGYCDFAHFAWRANEVFKFACIALLSGDYSNR